MITEGATSDIEIRGFRYYDNAMPLVDVAALMTLVKWRRPSRILEIGTSDGLTAACMARAWPPASIVTLDITREVVLSQALVPLPWGASLNVVVTRRMAADVRIDEEVAQRVQFVEVNSQLWEPDGRYDFVLIDGAHDIDSVAADSIKARSLLNEGGVIAWHDYDCALGARAVPDYLAELALEIPLFHVLGTTLVIHRSLRPSDGARRP